MKEAAAQETAGRAGLEAGAKKSRICRTVAYLAGILALAAAFLGAFLLPEYYSHWQDGMLLGQVRMEDRRNLGVPEEKEHAVADKMRMLREAGVFVWVAAYKKEGGGEDTEEAQRIVSQLMVCAEEWQRFGLLPQEILDLCRAGNLEGLSLYQATENDMGIYWIQLKADGNTMDFLMEQEGTCLFYASVVAEETDWLAQEEPIEQALAEDGSFHIREYCQAEYAILELYYEDYYGTIRLLYRDFHSFARRVPVVVEYLPIPKRGQVHTSTAFGFCIILDDGGVEEIVEMENQDRGALYSWLY